MRIDPEEVRRIARLARLHLEPGEEETLAGDLARIVEHMDSLHELELPEAGADDDFEQDVHREDRAAEGLSREDALANAPDHDGESFLVPRIVDREKA